MEFAQCLTRGMLVEPFELALTCPGIDIETSEPCKVDWRTNPTAPKLHCIACSRIFCGNHIAGVQEVPEWEMVGMVCVECDAERKTSENLFGTCCGVTLCSAPAAVQGGHKGGGGQGGGRRRTCGHSSLSPP